MIPGCVNVFLIESKRRLHTPTKRMRIFVFKFEADFADIYMDALLWDVGICVAITTI